MEDSVGLSSPSLLIYSVSKDPAWTGGIQQSKNQMLIIFLLNTTTFIDINHVACASGSLPSPTTLKVRVYAFKAVISLYIAFTVV